MADQQSEKVRDLMRTGMSATDNGDYERGYKSLGAFYGGGLDGLPLDGLSHFGLCIAVVEKQTRKGAELCQAAIKAQSYQAAHYVNLVKLYLERDDRGNAVKALEQGMRRVPGSPEINRIKARMRYRERARIALPFLPRRNPLNVLLGRIRAVFTK